MLVELMILAAESGGDGGGGGLPDLPLPAQYGILGLLVAALLTGKFLVPRYSYDREKDRADRLEEENRVLRDNMQNQLLPVLIRATDLFSRAYGRQAPPEPSPPPPQPFTDRSF